jgi:hypothetical protein
MPHITAVVADSPFGWELFVADAQAALQLAIDVLVADGAHVPGLEAHEVRRKAVLGMSWLPWMAVLLKCASRAWDERLPLVNRTLAQSHLHDPRSVWHDPETVGALKRRLKECAGYSREQPHLAEGVVSAELHAQINGYTGPGARTLVIAPVRYPTRGIVPIDGTGLLLTTPDLTWAGNADEVGAALLKVRDRISAGSP